MKKNSTLWLLLTALLLLPSTVKADDALFDFSNSQLNGYAGTALTDVQGYIYNKTFTVDGVQLQVTAGSAPSRNCYANNRDTCLVMYMEFAGMKFTAPEGKVITKIAFTQAGSGKLNLTTTDGTVDDHTWTGAAETLRFATSGTVYLSNIYVSVAEKTTAAAITYTECANIAAFNALEAGTYAKVTLTDAEVTGVSADGYSTVFVQDATGGCWIQYSSLNASLADSTKVNGTVYVVARANSGNVQMKEAEGTTDSELSTAAIEELTIAATGSISEVNVDDNKNRVVTITGSVLSLTAAGKTAGTLTDGDVTLAINNGSETTNQQLHKLASMDEFMDKEVVVTGILVGKSASGDLNAADLESGGLGESDGDEYLRAVGNQPLDDARAGVEDAGDARGIAAEAA